MRDWIRVEESMPDRDSKIDTKYDGVYNLRENITFRVDSGGQHHFGGIDEIDGKGSQPATHWRYHNTLG